MDDRSPDNAAGDMRNEAPHTVDAEDTFRILSGSEGILDPEPLLELKSRIRRSIDDPRPSLSLDDVDAFIDTLVAKAKVDGGRA